MKQARRLLEQNWTADELVEKLLGLSQTRRICLLDSCGAAHLGSHLLLCGVDPLETLEISNENPEETLRLLDEKLNGDNFAIFTLSYDFGLKLEKINPAKKENSHAEPDLFLALFDTLVVHDYNRRETFLVGDENKFNEFENSLKTAEKPRFFGFFSTDVTSNFTKLDYLDKIEKIKERIRCGDTYQTNLTQQLTAELPENLPPQRIFYELRKNHPAPFAAFLQRNDSTVISASPERFLRVESLGEKSFDSRLATRDSRLISTSPIKGTRPRGADQKLNELLKAELLNSEKDRAENVMIVDLLRNDLGRICEFGSVEVEKLCDLEEHPTLYHLVSTVRGKLRAGMCVSDILRAVFPCGSITGAPKIRTMQIIEELETTNRGLSMGAIGYASRESQVPSPKSQVSNPESNVQNPKSDAQRFYSEAQTLNSIPSEPTPDLHSTRLESGLGTWDLEPVTLDMSVAIRTMTVKNRRAIFNVGGGIVIDSRAEDEYEETLTKARVLLQAINGRLKLS